MSSTNETTPISIKIYYVICSFSVAFAVTAVTISITILALTWKVKRRLHTVRHLLTCNTCVASIFYCCVQTIHYVFLIFLPNETSDIGCRCRGYLSYITICGVAYSFLIQGISRLFIFLFSIKYPRLTTLKTHYLMIVIQWLLAVLFSSSYSLLGTFEKNCPCYLYVFCLLCGTSNNSFFDLWISLLLCEAKYKTNRSSNWINQ